MATVPSTKRSFFPIGYGLIPPEGPKVIDAGSYVFAAAGSIEVTLGDELSNQESIFCIQSMYFDNSSPGVATTVTLHPVNQRVTFGGQRQGWLPMAGVPGIGDFTLATSAAATVRILFCNVPIPAMNWIIT